MKTVGLIAMIALVGILGVAIALELNSQDNVNLNINASTNLTVRGVVVSDNPEECSTNFYLGCYRLESEGGVQYDLVEDNGNVNLSLYVGRRVQVGGRLADIRNKNVLMTSSVVFR